MTDLTLTKLVKSVAVGPPIGQMAVSKIVKYVIVGGTPATTTRRQSKVHNVIS